MDDYYYSAFSILSLTVKPSILIIDDGTAILHVFTKIFERKGCCVAVAEKGKDAVEKLNTKQYDVGWLILFFQIWKVLSFFL